MVGIRFWRDASQQLTFDMDHVPAADYPTICHAVVTVFALIQETPLVVGLDQMSWEWRRGEQVISLDWDIWMEFIVVAKTVGSESLVHDVATWLGGSQWGNPNGLALPGAVN